MVALRYIIKLGEFLIGCVDEIGLVILGIMISPYRSFGLGKRVSTRISEYTAGVDIEGMVIVKKKTGVKHQEDASPDDEGVFLYLGEM